MRRRIRLRPERITPDAGPWTRLLCRLFGHLLAMNEDRATFVYDLDNRLAGMLCERCGGLINAD